MVVVVVVLDCWLTVLAVGCRLPVVVVFSC